MASTEGRNEWRIAVALLAAGAVVRLVLAAVIPVFPDEAYYWVWSRRLAAGYFDHPPGIAVLIRTGAWADSPLGVRFVPVLAGFVAMLATAAIARRIGGDRAGLRAAIVATCLPIAAAGLILATPDAPLLAAAGLGLYAVVRALELAPGTPGSLAWWSAAGLALGLALCSKYTAVVPAAAVALALLLSPDLRPRLREPGPWVAALVAALVFLPVVLWNAQHDWVSFQFQFRHGLAAPKAGGAIAALKREGEYLAGLAGLGSPVLAVFFAVATLRGLSRRRSGAPFVLAVVALATVTFFAWSALRRRVEPNWPAPAYVPGIALLATLPWGERATRWLRAGIALAAVMTLLIYGQALRPILPIPPHRDPVGKAAGWDSVSAAVERARASVASESAATTWVAGDRYQEAALLSFHDGAHRAAFAVNLAGRRNQYDLWPGFAEHAAPGDNLVLVVDGTPEAHGAVRALEPYFNAMRPGELVHLRRGTGVVDDRRLWLLVGWRGGWPKANGLTSR